MEEHFNANFIESNRYPKATFKGKIQNFDINKITSSPKDYKISGNLKLHGKSKTINSTATIRKVNDEIEIISLLTINTEDFDISIPHILNQKISKTVTIQSVFMLK